jgi:hypothetical protein
MRVVDFYDDVLLELVTALGAALFVANAFALLRRGADRREAAREAVIRARPGSPVRHTVRRATTGRLDEAPLGRTVAFMALGLVVAVWGLASIAS